MVTTRGGTETPGAPTPTPRSSTRKTAGKRELEALETPTQAKRQRKTPAPRSSQNKAAANSDASAEEASQESADDVAAPTTEELGTPVVALSRESPDASSATEGKEDEAKTSHDAVFYTPAQRAGSVYETPATHRQPEGSPTPKAKEANVEPTPTLTKRGRGRPKKTLQKVSSPPQVVETPSKFNDEVPTSSYESSMAPILSQEAPPSAQPEKTHMHFDDDEESVITKISPAANKIHEAPAVTESEAESVQDEDENEDDASDSENEAPEVVTTAAASSKAQAAQADADRAQKAQQTKEEAKRKAREELIATQQAAKREREEKKAKKLAKKAAKEAKAAAVPEEEEAAVKPRLDIDLSNGLLPASLLENIDDQRAPTPPPERRGVTEEQLRKEKLNRHIKFLERTEKPAKEVKKGKLNVAVLAQQNKVLPPKVNRNTKNVREHWLKGRQVDKKNKKGLKPSARFAKMERRPHVNRGFLRNGDE
ncbi:hypothetical protein PTNB85_07593 [Pyrenophora teres f. teres]|uniref:U3-snoRNA-assoc multi-domain protein n=1 Tax=Pyrenophora teres f. teres TaxID=97479 RepID=A0A6S6W6X7_9PLEO|nr:hypothetical protein HRS9139_07624 [Pyrenophora teres f. teres]KAE8831006.1 hypothetical protein PTNB85_07593 [Pyrenophora teres f. teres]KAE8856994.1 hypothetical protein PTNB29_08061 [Pyrenophora teres f. teres]CAE7188396.1 U3-snoRNA-assoc multi-domain protein [Pyrenophora teres f. teres]